MPETRHDHVAPERARHTDAERAKAILTALSRSEPTSAEIFDAFWELDELPPEAVEAALASLGWRSDPDRLDAGTRRALGLPLPPLRLRTIESVKDADLFDCGPIAEEQLRLAGKSWDGRDLSPEERLDGEVEGSFAGTLERRVLAEADATGAPHAKPMFDVLRFADDAGVVFEAGTPRIVGFIAYGKVEMRDRRTRLAIEEAIAEAIEHAIHEPIAEETRTHGHAPEPARALAPALAIAPSHAAKARPAARAKTAVKKAAAKSTVAKKKPAAKKAPAKKAAAKKTAAKKKPAAKKAAARPAPARKTAKKAAKRGAKKR